MTTEEEFKEWWDDPPEALAAFIPRSASLEECCRVAFTAGRERSQERAKELEKKLRKEE
jgi:hypothetical protein